MKKLDPSSYRAVLTDILEFEILGRLSDSDEAFTVGQMVKLGVRGLLMDISDQEAGIILRRVAKHLDTYELGDR